VSFLIMTTLPRRVPLHAAIITPENDAVWHIAGIKEKTVLHTGQVVWYLPNGWIDRVELAGGSAVVHYREGKPRCLVHSNGRKRHYS
jgi:hypothetical protein